MTNDEIRLQFGELNATEMRLARAIVGWHEREQAKLIERIAVLQERNVDLENNRDKMEAEKAKLRAAADGLAEAVKAIVCPLGDETEDYGNPCTSPNPSQGRAIAAALAAYQATKP